MPKLNECIYIALRHGEKEELRKEAELQKVSMSDVARGRIFSDPITGMNEDMSLIATRSLTTLAIVNAIFQKIEPDNNVRKKVIRNFKRNILKSEEERIGDDVE